MSADSGHIPVMLNEVLAALAPRDGEVYVDGTFGAGGYTRAFLDAADCTVIAIDRDPEALARAQALKQEYGDRLVVLRGCFGDALALVRAAGFAQVDGFVLDIGVSSQQIDTPERGFSFRFEGPLDMRMDPTSGPSAADIVNTMSETDLANIIYQYGEERHSRKVARRIAERRQSAPFATTGELAELVRAAVPKSPKDQIDPATRTFQALRIAVNDELGELKRALNASESLLKEGGRLVIVSFHSLEDGIVKAFLYERSGRSAGPSRYVPLGPAQPDPTFALPHRKPVDPSDEEARRNPRARSARLRAGIRTAAPAWPEREAA